MFNRRSVEADDQSNSKLIYLGFRFSLILLFFDLIIPSNASFWRNASLHVVFPNLFYLFIYDLLRESDIDSFCLVYVNPAIHIKNWVFVNFLLFFCLFCNDSFEGFFFFFFTSEGQCLNVWKKPDTPTDARQFS